MIGTDTTTAPQFSAGIIAAVTEDIKRELSVPHNRMNRREVISHLRRAWSSLIADDVAAGRTPWVGTVDKYRFVAHLDEAYGARSLLPHTDPSGPLHAGYVQLAAIADADEAAAAAVKWARK